MSVIQQDKNPSLMTEKVNTAEKVKKEHTGPDANKKRLESLKQRKMENQSQKTAIKEALASVDKINTVNKKIVFDSDSEEEVITNINIQSSNRQTQSSSSSSPSSSTSSSSSSTDDNSSSDEDGEKNKSTDKKGQVQTAKKPALFEESSDSDDTSSSSSNHDDMFRIRPQFEGKSGNKLMALQSRFGNDDRFKLDERFAESSEDDSDNDDETGRGDKDTEINEDTERSRTLKILQEVVGDKAIINTDKKDRKKQMFKDISALQFDPSKEGHTHFVVNQEIKSKPDKSKDRKKKKDNIAEKDEPVEETPVVGREKFYEVTDSLRQAFVQKETEEDNKQKSFSLLAAFGRTEDADDDKMDEHIDNRDTEMKIIVGGNKNIFPWQDKKFKYDSSDTEDEHSDMETDNESENERSVDDKVKPVVFGTKRHTFFFTEDDSRIKDGIAFFWRKEDIEVIREKWLEKRPYLIEAYRNKHKRLSRKHRINNRFKSQQRKK
ncbi:hypothetical protein KUTeg_021297 [Tegillarca granosa]|uniref:Nucleolar protein 8 n=1 Tax=Tegillarca granosa TaxID=220873 RepID=A0ABQ9EFU6_TEGGR|nr:hypothetical protein KUTeg_021297 [Tegillarca granosa]